MQIVRARFGLGVSAYIYGCELSKIRLILVHVTAIPTFGAFWGILTRDWSARKWGDSDILSTTSLGILGTHPTPQSHDQSHDQIQGTHDHPIRWGLGNSGDSRHLG